MDTKTVVVCGGGSKQGNAAAKQLLDGGWRVRLIVRSDTAESIKKRKVPAAFENGCHHRADIVTVPDGSAQHLIERVLKDAHALVLITFTVFDDEHQEFCQAQRWIDACFTSGVKLLVFSGGEKTGFPRLDVKHSIESYTNQKIAASSHSLKAVFVHSCFFFENLIHRVVEIQGTVLFSMPCISPSHKISMVSSEDVGRVCAMAVLQADKFKDGEVIPAVGDVLSMADFVAIYSRVTERMSTFVPATADDFKVKLKGTPGLDLMIDIYTWLTSIQPQPLEEIHALYPKLLSCSEWLAQVTDKH